MKINIQNRIIHRVFPVVTAFIIFAMSVFSYSPIISASTVNSSSSEEITSLDYTFWQLKETITAAPQTLCFPFILPYESSSRVFRYLSFDNTAMYTWSAKKSTAYYFEEPQHWVDDKKRYIYILDVPDNEDVVLQWLKENGRLISRSNNSEKPTEVIDLFNTTWRFNTTSFVPPSTGFDTYCMHITSYDSDSIYSQICATKYTNVWRVTGNSWNRYLYYEEMPFTCEWIRFTAHCTETKLIEFISNNATLTGWDVDPPEIPAYVPPEQGGVQPVLPEVTEPSEPAVTEPVTPTVPGVTEPVTPSVPVEPLDYSDLITDIKTVEGVSYVTFEIPMEYLLYQVTVDDNIIAFDQGNSVTYESSSSGIQEVKFYFDDRGRLDASCLPSTTTFSANILVNNTPGTSTPLLRFAVRAWLPDTSFNEIGFASSTAELSTIQTLTVSDLVIPTNAQYIDFSFEYDGWQSLSESSVQRTVTVDSLSMTMTVDSLFMQQQQSQKTNALLEAVENNLAENGKKLDEVLSGENLNDHDVNGPGGFNDKVNQQQNQMQNNMADINNVEKPDPNTAIPDVGSYVPAEGSNLLAIVMGGITGFSLVPTYLLIVVGLFVVSFIMFGKKES